MAANGSAIKVEGDAKLELCQRRIEVQHEVVGHRRPTSSGFGECGRRRRNLSGCLAGENPTLSTWRQDLHVSN